MNFFEKKQIKMTRFARKAGAAENKETKKKKEEPTEWNDMFNDKAGKNENDAAEKSDNEEEKKRATNDLDELEVKKRKHQEDYDKRIALENENSLVRESKKLKNTTTDQDLIDKYSSSIDKEVLDYLIEIKAEGKIGQSEFEERLFKESRSNQRRLNRQVERETSRVCFKCRKPGHSLNECPQMKKDSEQGAGICYKCGSTEHSVNRCKVKTEPGRKFRCDIL